MYLLIWKVFASPVVFNFYFKSELPAPSQSQNIYTKLVRVYERFVAFHREPLNDLMLCPIILLVMFLTKNFAHAVPS
jgi:hypothetical protein